jgi:diguanylate cyclase (GGDEF)-like protein
MKNRSNQGRAYLSPTQHGCGGLDYGLLPSAHAALLGALDHGPQAVALFDPDDRLAYGNGAFRSAWNVEDGSHPTFAAIMQSCYEEGVGAIIQTDDINTWIAAAILRRRTGQDFRAFAVDFFDGRWFWLTEKRLDDGWILFIGQDITALKHSEQTLRAARDIAVKAAVTDPLTQLDNRRGALQQLSSLLAKEANFYLAMIDIDEFKRINDEFGHATGDAVLNSVACELRQLEASGCLVGRLAGDEFSVISPHDCTKAHFAGLLEDFAKSVGKLQDLNGYNIPVTMSVGISQSYTDGATIEALLATADAAMYEVKRNGRSAIRFFESWMRLGPREAA